MKSIIPGQNTSLELAIALEQEISSIRQIENILNLEEQAQLVGANGEAIPIPETVYQVLRQVVQAMALGKAISIVTYGRELTTQQAAEILNVSRPYLTKLLDQDEIPHIKVGTHRRIRFEDLMRYKQQRDIKRRKLLDELIAESQELGFYE